MKNLGIGNGTLSYHLYMLEKMEMIKSRREGIRYRAFYVTGFRFPKEEKYRFSELQSSIMKLIKKNNGISQKEIASSLGEKQQTISYNVKVLERNGILKLEKKGRETRCFIFKDEQNTKNNRGIAVENIVDGKCPKCGNKFQSTMELVNSYKVAKCNHCGIKLRMKNNN